MKKNQLFKNSFYIFAFLILFLILSNPVSLAPIATPVEEDMYLRAKEITINHTLVQSDLTDFPFLFTMINSDFSICQIDGDDIVFYDITGVNQLKHEIEFFNPSSGELVSWVLIPFLSSSVDTKIQMLYGSSSSINSESPLDVWSEYDGVYHLSQLNDATGAHDLTQTGSVIPDTNGKFATAQTFDGYGNDYLMTNTNFGVTTSFTIECWVKIDDSDTDQTFLALPHSYTGVAQRLMLDWESNVALARNYQSAYVGANTNGTSAINDGAWHYLVHTYDNQSNKLYVDGQLEGSDQYSGIVRCLANQFYIGREGWNTETGWPETVMNGSIDEVSVTKNVLTAARIMTEYNNQYDPSAFYSIVATTPITITTITTIPITTTPSTTTLTTNDNSIIGEKLITIDHTQVMDDLVNFPLLFTTTDRDLSICQIDGDDIVFYDETGKSQLDHEIEFFNQNSGELVAWIRIPYLSSIEDTKIYMLYGNPSVTNSESPSAVWSEYDGVYHLSQLNDATGAHDLTQTGSVIPDTNGKFATAQTFDGYGNDYLMTNTNFGVTTSFTIECWVKIDDSDTDQTFLALPHSYTGVAQRLMLDWESNVALARNYQSAYVGANTNGTSAINDGAWHYLVHTYDNQSNKLYVDGQLEGSDQYSGIVRCLANQFYIGREGWNTETGWPETVMNGSIDEVSVTKNVLTAARIMTEYNNQHDPSAFYSIGSPIPTLTPGFLPIISLTGILCLVSLVKRKR